MKKSIKFEFKLTFVGAIVLVGLGLFYGPIQQYHNASGAYSSPSGQSAQSSSTFSSSSNAPSSSSNNSLALSVKEAAGVYKWTNATTGTENPELNLRF